MKKIMFKDRYGLTQAVLEGRKTMTRRIIPDIEIDWNRRGRVKLPIKGFEYGMLFMDTSSILPDCYFFPAPSKYQPRYEIGEVVAVAQAYKNDDVLSFNAYDNVGAYHLDGLKRHKEMLSSPGYRNKMFVKAEYMPHRIRITDIKVERLQDISHKDCLKEGITTITEGKKEVGNGFGWDTMADALERDTFFTAKAAFAALIDRISGRGTWERNPWVYAYEFELIK